MQVLPDVLWFCQHGLRTADPIENTQLATSLQILPLVGGSEDFSDIALSNSLCFRTNP